MGFLGRGSIPANYEDFITTVGGMGLSLPTPVPQFFFAKAAMAGRLSAAAMQAGLTGPRALVELMGGGAQHPELASLVTMEEELPGLINVVEELNSEALEGDTIKFQRPVYSVGGLSESSRKLVPGPSIGTTGRTVRLEEVPMTVGEYHGPYASDGSAVQPFEIRQFDAKFKKNKIGLASMTAHHLTYDYTAWLNAVMVGKFCNATNTSNAWSSAAGSGYVTYPSADQSAVTTYVAGGGAFFSAEQLIRARQALRDRYVPPLPNGRYPVLVPTVWNTHMLGDVMYRDLSKSHREGVNQIFGYITSIEDMDIFECNDLPTYAAAGTYAGGTVPTGVSVAEGFICGAGAVGFGCAVAPEVRFSDSTNYQTRAMVVWYSVQSQDVLDERFIQRFNAQTT